MEGYSHYANITPESGSLHITCFNLLNNGDTIIIIPVFNESSKYLIYSIWIRNGITEPIHKMIDRAFKESIKIKKALKMVEEKGDDLD